MQVFTTVDLSYVRIYFHLERNNLMNKFSRYLSKETVEALLAAVGVIATVVGTVQVFIPNVLTVFPEYSLACLVVVVCLATYLVVRPRRRLQFQFNDGRFTLELVVADLFDDSAIVLTADQALNSDVLLVGGESLIGQAQSRISDFPSPIESYRGQETKLKPGVVVDLNELVTSDGEKQRVFVLACGRPTADGTETGWKDLSDSYLGLWNFLRSKNITEVTVPVIGSGFSGARLSHGSLLQLLIFSYYSAFSDRPVVKKLRIVVDEDDYNWDAWQRASRVLDGLGVKKA